jgi:predicted PurR-regulated permease PerM
MPDLQDRDSDIASLLAETPLRVRSAVLIVLMLLAVLYTAYFAAVIIVPIVGAFLLNFLFSPLVMWLVRAGVPRVVAAALIIVGLVIGVSGIFYSLADPAAEWLRTAPVSIEAVRSKLGDGPDALSNVRQATEAVEEAVTELAGEPEATQVQIREPRLLVTVMNGMPIVVAGVMLSTFLTFLLLISADSFLRKLTSLGESFRVRRRIVLIVRQLERQLAHYLGTVTLINSGLGLIVAGAMYLVGLPNPALWGAVAAILNFAPYLGPAVTAGILFLAAVNVFDTLSGALLAPSVFLAITILEGQVITPVLLGHRLDLSPVVVFISVVVFGWLWGVIGALMAVPIVSTLKICLINLPRTRMLGTLLGK